MKKTLALLLALVMVLALAACGQSAAPAAAPAESAAPAAEAEAAPAEEAAAPALKAGFIFLHDETSTYDLNFMNAAKEACEKLGLAEGTGYIIKTNIPEGQECYDAAAELVDEGCNFIFADSFGHESFMIMAAKEFPDVQFCHATGTQAHTVGLANYHNGFASIYEGRFLGGVAAGLKLNEMIEAGTITEDQAKVGYIGAFPYAEVKSGYTSFFLGVRYACPSATMDVTFTNSWYDPTLEKEGAIKLINNGCVLISEHADSMGAPTECESNNIPFVFYNGSAAVDCPNTFIVASRIDWAPYMEYAMTCTMNGEQIPADWTGTIATGSVKLTEVNEKAAAAGTVEKLAEVQAMLEDGSLKVFDTSTWTVNGETLTEYQADVDDMGDFVPETNVIADGYFHESEFRSAPYFDIDIDGITNLDA
ncbi:MAG: BMP family ABC transporter substrate-binding protein [Oscillospiraceae bacterium]|nr:BMP family ABC transporter substrate-binding protein [Oscillospiraceae bacterium]